MVGFHSYFCISPSFHHFCMRLFFFDAWFTSTSAVCVTGLSVVDTHALSAGSQFVVLLLVFLGGTAFSSFFPALLHLWRIGRSWHRARADIRAGGIRWSTLNDD